MTEHTFLHVVRDPRGEPVATLRCVRGDPATRIAWLDAMGARVLVAEVSGPGATRVFDGSGRDIHSTDRRAGAPHDPALSSIGSSGVVRSCEVGGHPVWIIDDYGNRTRHFIFGCAPDLFLHVHLDAQGAVTLTEKTREHETLRITRRDAAGALLADEALVQPGESLDDVARRCGAATDFLLATNPALAGATPGAGSLPAGTVVQIA